MVKKIEKWAPKRPKGAKIHHETWSDFVGSWPQGGHARDKKMDIGLWKMDNGQKEMENGKWKMASDKKQVASKREMVSEMI